MENKSIDDKNSENHNKKAERVIAYVDGFNLYFGIREAQLGQYLWLNVHKLAGKLCGPQQVLGATKYFTARISGSKPGDSSTFAEKKNSKRKRQTTYLDALETIPQITRYEGNYRDDRVTCNGCNRFWYDQEEKMTDVSIATEMLSDAYEDRCDTLILISGDSDLVPPVKKIMSFGDKRVIAAFPPCRWGSELAQVSTGKRQIERGHLKKCQLDPEIKTSTGFTLKRPAKWK